MAKKQKTQKDIEMYNIQQEIEEILETCTKCGMCKANCPIFKNKLQEEFSPRGQVLLMQEGVEDKILFYCNLCKACEKSCALGIKICDAVRKGREILSAKGKQLESNEEMIKNIRETGNPSGKNPGSNDKLYCC
jgi:Fe-S oxidoreductase